MEGQIEGQAVNQAAPIQVQSVSANVVYDAQGNAYQLVPVQPVNNNAMVNVNLNNSIQNGVQLQVQNNNNYSHIPNNSHSNMSPYSTDQGIPMANGNYVNPSASAPVNPNYNNQYTTDAGPANDNSYQSVANNIPSAPNAPVSTNVINVTTVTSVSSVSTVQNQNRGATNTSSIGTHKAIATKNGNNNNNNGNNELIYGCIPINYFNYDGFLISNVMPYTNTMTGIISIEYVVLMICMYSFVQDYNSYFWYWLGLMGMMSCLYLTFQYFKYLRYKSLKFKYQITDVKDINFPLLPQNLSCIEIPLRIMCLFIDLVSLILVLPNMFALPFTVWVLMPMCFTIPQDPVNDITNMYKFLFKFRIVPNYQAQKEFVKANSAAGAHF